MTEKTKDNTIIETGNEYYSPRREIEILTRLMGTQNNQITSKGQITLKTGLIS
jgi:hypothetical protein